MMATENELKNPTKQIHKILHPPQGSQAHLHSALTRKRTESASNEMAVNAHQRNVAACRMQFESCDRSKLTPPEALALAISELGAPITKRDP